MLRGAATKAGQKKTNNFDACMERNGRRLRHVNAEKKLEDWWGDAEEPLVEILGFGLADANELQGSSADQNPNSVEVVIETSVSGATTKSTCNNGSRAEISTVTDGCEREKSSEFAEDFLGSGSKAAKEGDYGEATDCFSRALEIM